MSFLLSFCRLIDNINVKIGQWVSWSLLIAVLICSGNAIFRYAFNISSNAWLEIQWYLFGLLYLLAASYTLRVNEHVRIDVISSRFSTRTRVWMDIIGFVVFFFPFTLIVLYYATPYALLAIETQEMSSNAGGLILWPAKIIIPIGFLMLTLQGLSELIKRIGYLQGLVDASEFEKTAAPMEMSAATSNTK